MKSNLHIEHERTCIPIFEHQVKIAFQGTKTFKFLKLKKYQHCTTKAKHFFKERSQGKKIKPDLIVWPNRLHFK